MVEKIFARSGLTRPLTLRLAEQAASFDAAAAAIRLRETHRAQRSLGDVIASRRALSGQPGSDHSAP